MEESLRRHHFLQSLSFKYLNAVKGLKVKGLSLLYFCISAYCKFPKHLVIIPGSFL